MYFERSGGVTDVGWVLVEAKLSSQAEQIELWLATGPAQIAHLLFGNIAKSGDRRGTVEWMEKAKVYFVHPVHFVHYLYGDQSPD